MTDKYWLEVSLVVDGELAEAVADVLRRYLPDGVVIESTGVSAGPADENGQAVGPLRVYGYIPVDEHLEETRRKIEEGLWYLGRITPLPEPVIKQIQEVNWMEAWKEHYHPIPIGKRLIILPAWIDAVDDDRIPIRIELGMAFGTGTHPTTQLCLEQVENFFTSSKDTGELRVIDIGCGSSILSIAALKLGAEKALAVDIDPLAISASAENARLNGVIGQLELELGSVAEVKAGQFGIQKAQLVLANILAPVLVELLGEGLGDLVLQGGWLVLSGIMLDQSIVVEAALKSHGLDVINISKMGDWVAITAK